MHVSNPPTRRTQAERRAQSRNALLESAARGLSHYGYGNLVLEQVAQDAGYTRGALYHQFRDKEELVRAVLEWVAQDWIEQVGAPASRAGDPVAELLALARGHAIYCRQDVARVGMVLRVEFSGRDHPIGHAGERVIEGLVERLTRLIAAGRRSGALPPGPPPRVLARAVEGALEGVVIMLAGKAPHDADMAERATRGLLGLPVQP